MVFANIQDADTTNVAAPVSVNTRTIAVSDSDGFYTSVVQVGWVFGYYVDNPKHERFVNAVVNTPP